MSSGAARPAVVPPSLARLRLRVTVWYAGSFFAMLALLGGGIFAAITRRFDSELDASLRDAAQELVRATSTAMPVIASNDPGAIVRIVRIPGRTLHLTDSSGQSLSAAALDPWTRALARRAAAADSASATHSQDDRILRAHAQRFQLVGGRTVVAVALGDEVELEDRYTALIVAFGAAALAAVLLVVAGGYVLARKSTDPVERALEHMRRFMADAAHELRTPLTAMRSRAEVTLARPRAPETYVAALRSLERETIHLSQIVDDLLMLARADAGQRPIQRTRLFLDDVLLDAAEAARAIAAPRGVRVEVGAFDEAPVTGDPQLLRQLAMILLDNAVKFTEPQGAVRAAVEQINDAARLTIMDTGIGIAEDQLPHVFERFYRADAARTHDAGSDGVGLGLSIAQWIAEQHGAHISIDSRTGQGTRVVVQFPRATAPERLSSS